LPPVAWRRRGRRLRKVAERLEKMADLLRRQRCVTVSYAASALGISRTQAAYALELLRRQRGDVTKAVYARNAVYCLGEVDDDPDIVIKTRNREICVNKRMVRKVIRDFVNSARGGRVAIRPSAVARALGVDVNIPAALRALHDVIIDVLGGAVAEVYKNKRKTLILVDVEKARRII